jgi:hypothetical protein
MSIVAPVSPPPHQPDPLAWQPLPHGGLNGGVDAIAVLGSDLYVGGSFTETADGLVQNLNGIAKLSGGNWTALLHNGVKGSVTALAVSGTDLYVGGYFTTTADGGVPNLNNIARLSGGITWQALANNGLNWDVTGLGVNNGDLYVGGYFSQTADGAVKDLNLIAKYSAGNWSALPNKGLADPIEISIHCCSVRTFAFSGNNLYAGGIFYKTGDGAQQNLYDVAKLSGGVWSTPNNGLIYSLNSGLLGVVHSLLFSGGGLYATGVFTETGDGQVKNLNGIARLTGETWSALPHNGLKQLHVSGGDALVGRGTEVYVGGFFTETADGQVQNLNSIAKYSGGAWAPLPNNGLNNTVAVLAFNGNDLYAGGYFTGTADGLVTNLNNIAVLSLPAIPNFPIFLPVVRR